MNDASTVHYRLDAGGSTFTVQAFAAGFLSGFGHNPTIAIREFAGEAEFSPEALEEANLRLEINARSLAVLDDIKEKDRQDIERTMHEDVLDTAQFPEIVFRSTSVTPTRIIPGRWKAKIIGDLTLHGATRSVWIIAQIFLEGDELRAKGDFTLKQTDFGIRLVSVAAGALKLKDELIFEFDLIGTKG